jgi:hypothetical protein
MPLIWIRINPDSFKIDDTKINMSKKEKIEKVVNLINYLSNIKDTAPLMIYYCFYNIINNKPEILKDEKYPEELKQVVKYLI